MMGQSSTIFQRRAHRLKLDKESIQGHIDLSLSLSRASQRVNWSS